MSENAASSGSTPAPKPWRKRHPIVSRTILYSLGLGLGVLLIVLLLERLDDDRATELDALQKELDALSLVLASDPTGGQLLTLLDEKFSDPEHPVFLRGRSLRWRAIAWRANAEGVAPGSEHDAERAAAWAQADAAFKACGALDLEPAERYAMQLEQTEGLLLRKETEAALAVLPAEGASQDPVQQLMRQFLLAQTLRLQHKGEDALVVLRTSVRGLERAFEGAHPSYVGGDEWTRSQIAIQMANFVTSEGGEPADAALWIHLRALGAEDYDVQKSAAKGLVTLGSQNEARTSWRNARRLNASLAARDAAQDKVLGTLDARLRSR